MNQISTQGMGLSHSRIVMLYTHVISLCESFGLHIIYDDIEFNIYDGDPETVQNKNEIRTLLTSRFIDEVDTFLTGYRRGHDTAIKSYVKGR